MPQEVTLLDGSIDANLRIGDARIDAADLDKAMAVTGLGELVNRLPKGLSMPVGPGGRRLSGGERQVVP